MPHKSNGAKNLKNKTSAARSTSKGKEAKSAKLVKSSKNEKAGKPAKSAKTKETAASKSGKSVAKAAVKEKDLAAPPKKKRSKSGVVRLKAFWGVFNQMMKRVQVFEYAEKRQADKRAAELSTSAKAPHFVQLVKEVIRDGE